jgi:hypothetical protein
MLQKAATKCGYSKFTTNTPGEVTMGYEYEDYVPQNKYYEGSIFAANMAKLLPTHFKVRFEGFGGGMGCEIKSVVAPLSIQKLFIKKYLDKISLSTLPNEKTNGGIHINISSNGPARIVWKEVFRFLHDLDNRESFFKLSKRTRRSFDQNAPSHPNVNQNFGRLEYTDHYNIINWQNTERFEFRLFAAHPTLLLPALEMADSLFKYAHDVDTITFDGWRAYINRFKKYEHIKEHCIECLDRSTQ